MPEGLVTRLLAAGIRYQTIIHAGDCAEREPVLGSLMKLMETEPVTTDFMLRALTTLSAELARVKHVCADIAAAKTFGDLTVPVESTRVVAAAKHLDGVTFSVARPARHSDLIKRLYPLGITGSHLKEQGFLLSDGTWADRRSARKVAERAGQLRDPRTAGVALSTEDVW